MGLKFPTPPISKYFFSKFLAINFALAVAGTSQFANAATQNYQDANAANVWDTTTFNWDAGTSKWTNGNDAVFGGTGETVEVNAAISANSITFNVGGYTITDTDSNGSLALSAGNGITAFNATNTTGTNTVSMGLTFSSGNSNIILIQAAGGTLALTGAINYSTSELQINSGGTGGTITLNGSGSGAGQSRTIDGNPYNVTMQLSGGTLVVSNANALSTGAVLFDNTSTIRAGVNNIVIANTLVASPSVNGAIITFNGTNNVEYSGMFVSGGGGNGRTISIANTGTTLFSGTQSLSNSLATAKTVTFDVASTAGAATISGNIVNSYAGSGTAASGITKQGAGTLTLSGTANSYTGVTTISGGILSVSTLANGGSASSIGASTNAAANLVLQGGGTLRYIGTSASTDRSLTVGASGGSINVSNAATTLGLAGASVGGNTLTMSGPGSVTFSATVGGSSGATIAVTGGGITTLSGSADNSFLGATVTSGTLILNKASDSNNHALGGTILINGGVLQLAGSGGDQIYSGAGVTLTSGAFDLNGQTESFNGLNIQGTGISNGGALINSTAATSGTLNNAVTLTNDTSMGGAGNVTIANAIGGSTFALTKVGTGTLTLSSANTLGGGLKINAGTVVLGNVTAAGSPTITLGNSAGSSATLQATNVNVANAINLGSNSAGALTIGNNGNNAATFSGAIGLNGNALTLASGGAGSTTITGGITGTGNLTLAPGSSATGSTGNLTLSTTTINNAGTITNAGTVTTTGVFGSTSNTSFAGTAITAQVGSNVTGIVQNGPSALLLSANNSAFNGGITIQSGAVLFNNTANALGANTSAITFKATSGNTATLSYGGRFAGVAGNPGSFANPITLDSTATGANVIGVSDYNLTLSGAVTLNGGNTLTFSPNNSATFGSNITVSGGVTGSGNIVVSNQTSEAGDVVNFTTAQVNNSGTITFNNASVNGGTAGTGNGTNTITGGVGSNVTAITTSAVNNPLTISTNTLNVNSGGTTLTNANTTAGAFTVSGGIGGTGNLILKNNSAIASGIIVQSAGVNNTGLVTNQGTGSGSVLISSVIGSNVTGVTQNSSNSLLTLSNANTFSGVTTVTSGTLNLSNQNAIQNSTLTMNGGSIVFDSSVAGNAFTVGGLSSSGSGAGYDIALQNNAGTPVAIALTVGGTNNASYAGVLSGTGPLTKVGSGMQTFSNANTYTGVTTVNAGILSTNNLANGGSASGIGSSSNAASNLVVNSGTLQYTGTSTSTDRGFSGSNGGIDVSQAGTTLTLTGTSFVSFTKSGAGGLTIGTGTTAGAFSNNTATVNGGTLTLTGASDNISASAAVNAGTLVLAKVSNNNIHALGNTITVSGGTLQLAGSGGDQIYDNSNVTVNSGTFDLNGLTEKIKGLQGSGGTVTNSAATSSTLRLGGFSSPSTYSGNIQDGAGSVALAVDQDPNVTVTLSGNNTYSGATTIGGGGSNVVLTASSTTALSANSAYTLANNTGVALNLNGFNNTIGSLTGGGTTGGNVALGSGTLTLGANNANASFAGIISGAGGVSKTGTGTQTLTGANTYTGQTLVNSGTLTINNNGSTTAGKITGSGTNNSIQVNSGGTLLLNGGGTNDRISNVAGTTLNGGKFITAGSSKEGTAATVTSGVNDGTTNAVGLGALTLSVNSTLDFDGATNGSLLAFTSFNPGSSILSVTNWTNTHFNGSQNSGLSTDDRLVFDQDLQAAGLLSQINFGSGLTTQQIALGNGFYEIGAITAVPEPATIFGPLALLGLVGYRERRRIFKA